jgi:hypothetical protein
MFGYVLVAIIGSCPRLNDGNKSRSVFIFARKMLREWTGPRYLLEVRPYVEAESPIKGPEDYMGLHMSESLGHGHFEWQRMMAIRGDCDKSLLVNVFENSVISVPAKRLGTRRHFYSGLDIGEG